MEGIFLLPALYVILGVVYGPIVLIVRLKSFLAFKKLSSEEFETLDLDSPVYEGTTGLQKTNFVFNVLMLVTFVGLLLFFGNAGGAWFGILGLLALPLFVLGFNAPSIWNKERVLLENAALVKNVTKVRNLYAVMIPVWLISIIGSYLLAFSFFPRIS